MNCQELALILDERDLDRLPAAERRVAEAHLADCPACARDHDLHFRLNRLPIPPLSAQRIAGWRAVALSGADADAGAVSAARQRRRSRLIVISTLVALAAAAAWLAQSLNEAREAPVAEVTSEQQLASVVQPAAAQHAEMDATPQVIAVPDFLAEQSKAVPASAPQPAGSFTVLVLPLQIDGGHPAARSMGEEFYARFLDQLRQIPGLALQPDSKRASNTKPADFRLRITSGYGKVPERFGGHQQWILNLVAETLNQDSGAYTQALAVSNNPDCGRISPADLASASMCTPAGTVELDIQQLRRTVFPPDPSAARQLQARYLDASLSQGVRRQALAELIELRQKAPGAMDRELVRAIIGDAIANAQNPAQRAMLWRALRGQSGAIMIPPLIENLRRELDDSVRLEMVGMMAAEFSADPAARAELALVERRDAKLLVRKVAERALSGNASWQAYVVSTVRDASLPAAARFEPLAWMGETGILRTDPKMDAELVAIARQLFDDGDAVALAEVLTQASSGSGRPTAGVLQIRMSSLAHPAVADFLIATVERQADFSAFSLLGRHRTDPRIEAKLKDIAANHPDANVRQLAAAQFIKQ